MAEKKRGLGRGLDSLIPPVKEKKKEAAESAPKESPADAAAAGTSPEGTDYIMVRISKVEPDRTQPRRIFPEESLNELAASIKDVGLIEPLIVTANAKSGGYTIVAGERRWRACRIAGIKEIPVIIREFASEQEKVETSLIENIQREDLNPIDEAAAYQRLMEEFGLKQDEVADRVHRNRSTVANSVRLLKLSEEVRNLVAAGKLPMGHARALIPVEDPETQKNLADLILEKDLSVRETERLVKNLGKEKPEKKENAFLPYYNDIAGRMNESLGMKVAIQPKGEKGGKLTIEFSGNDDFEKLMDLLITQQQ